MGSVFGDVYGTVKPAQPVKDETPVWKQWWNKLFGPQEPSTPYIEEIVRPQPRKPVPSPVSQLLAGSNGQTVSPPPTPSPTPTPAQQVQGSSVTYREHPGNIKTWVYGDSPTPTGTPTPTKTPSPQPTIVQTKPTVTPSPQPTITSTPQPQGSLSRKVPPKLDPEVAKNYGIVNWYEPTVDKYTKKLTTDEATTMIKKYFEPSDVSRALEVMNLESGRQVYNFNQLGAMGLYQFMPTENKREALNKYFGEDIYENGKIYDAETNVKAAAALLYGDLRNPPQGSGWQHFETVTNVHPDWLDNGSSQFPQRKKK